MDQRAVLDKKGKALLRYSAYVYAVTFSLMGIGLFMIANFESVFGWYVIIPGVVITVIVFIIGFSYGAFLNYKISKLQQERGDYYINPVIVLLVLLSVIPAILIFISVLFE
jgi:hypothetical protein